MRRQVRHAKQRMADQVADGCDALGKKVIERQRRQCKLGLADITVVEQVAQSRGTGSDQRVEVHGTGIDQVVEVELELGHHVRRHQAHCIDRRVHEVGGLQQPLVDQPPQRRQTVIEEIRQIHEGRGRKVGGVQQALLDEVI